MEYLARYVGLKAVACRNFECHGMTLVQADGTNYYVTTGFEGERPRKYMINLLRDDDFKNLCIKNRISLEYFGF